MTAIMEAVQGRLKRPFRFVVVGLLNTAVGLGVIYGCKFFLEFGNVLANVVGYACGITVSFLLNSSWTFEYRGPKLAAAAEYTAPAHSGLHQLVAKSPLDAVTSVASR